MKIWSRLSLAAAGMMIAVLVGIMLTSPSRIAAQGNAPAPKGKATAAPGKAPAAAAAKGKQTAKTTAGLFFANVTTKALSALTPDDFLAAMGVMADSLGLDCADCHPGAGSDKVDWVIDTPPKKMARKMVDMVQTINATNFPGRQMVTCWTCHHGRDIPATTISLEVLYSTPNGEKDDVVRATPGQFTADQILDKYIAALGGAQKVNALTSYIVTGESVGYEGLGGNGTFNIYAKAPDSRTTQISFKDHPERGDSTWEYDGKTAWIKVPRGLLGTYEVSGASLEGTKLEGRMSFPGQIKTALTNWKVGPMESIGTKDFYVLQGSGPQGLLATLYFDTSTNLLTRVLRYTSSPVGRAITQVDYSDYRDVNGVKFPFNVEFLWLDGRWSAKISNVQTNVAIPAGKFNKP